MATEQRAIFKTKYDDIEPYTTKDGSIIRELMHPDVHGNSEQSLAEATIPIGSSTTLHQHPDSEEIYHITAGSGCMYLGVEVADVVVGDTVCIPPGTPHRVENTGRTVLKILCCCSPPYSHTDTELLT
ncbi:MAG: cupin domain-containing protein [Deltaproteobacteria bacterium]|nr:MAG: cupin domain-containing protein [Deltaproteobacteria bacterium]